MHAESPLEAYVRRAIEARFSREGTDNDTGGTDRRGLLERIKAQGDDCAMDADEAAFLLGCSESAFRRLRLPSMRLGARLYRWRYGTLRQHQRLLENRSELNA